MMVQLQGTLYDKGYRYAMHVPLLVPLAMLVWVKQVMSSGYELGIEFEFSRPRPHACCLARGHTLA